jgi:hypothetical protein
MMTEPRSYTFPTATLHGKVIGAGVTLFGLSMLLIPDLAVEDASPVGIMMVVVGAIFFYMSMRQSMTKEARLTVDADGVWFRDWRMDTVPWREIADIYTAGSRFKPMICVELRDPEGFAARLPEDQRARLWRNPLVRMPVLRIAPKTIAAPAEAVMKALRSFPVERTSTRN